MQSVVRLLSVCTVSAALLAGCGGGFSFVIGDDDDDDHGHSWHPYFSGRPTSLTVDGSDNRLDGTWSTANTELTQVLRFSGTSPEVCAFQFYGVPQQDGGRFMDGEIRYVVDSGVTRTVLIGIGAREYRLDGGAWNVDRSLDRVNFDGAVLQSLDVTGETLRLTGTVPLPRDRPGGC